MLFNRTLEAKNTIEITGTSSIDLGVVFKQYDVGSSTLVMETTYNGSPTQFTNEKVYMTYKINDKKLGSLLPVKNSYGVDIIDTCCYSARRSGVLTVDVDKDVLLNSGDILAELVIVSNDFTKRFTSPTLRFKIEPSLIDSASSLAVVNTFGCGEAMCGQGSSTKEKRELAKVTSFLDESMKKLLRKEQQ